MILISHDQDGRRDQIKEEADIEDTIQRPAVIARGVHGEDGVREGAGERDQLREDKDQR